MISVKLDVDLICPDCGEHNLFARAALVPGKLVGCEHCGAELFLNRYQDYPAEPPVWLLESSQPDDAEARLD